MDTAAIILQFVGTLVTVSGFGFSLRKLGAGLAESSRSALLRLSRKRQVVNIDVALTPGVTMAAEVEAVHQLPVRAPDQTRYFLERLNLHQSLLSQMEVERAAAAAAIREDMAQLLQQQSQAILDDIDRLRRNAAHEANFGATVGLVGALLILAGLGM